MSTRLLLLILTVSAVVAVGRPELLIRSSIEVGSREAQRRKDKSCRLCAFVRTPLLLRAFANLRDCPLRGIKLARGGHSVTPQPVRLIRYLELHYRGSRHTQTYKAK